MSKIKMQRILHLCGWYFPDSVGGTEIYVRSLAKELIQLGWDVIIAAPSTKEKEEMYVHDGIEIYRYPVSLAPSHAEVKGDVKPKYIEVFINKLHELKPDLVHMHSYTGGCGSFHAQAIKELGIPLIFTVHIPGFTCVRGTMMRWGKIPCDGLIKLNRCTACVLHQRGVPRFLAEIASRLIPQTHNRFTSVKSRWATGPDLRRSIANRTEQVMHVSKIADHIVVVSEWLFEVLMRNGFSKSKVSVSRHGLSRISFTEKRKVHRSSALRMGYIGRLDPVKGVHVLVQAIKLVPRNIAVQLYIYGRANSQEDKTYLEKLRHLSETDRRIHICNEVGEHERDKIFGELDIVAIPSIWLETGPMVALEAFVAGVPIIGSDLGGIAEIVTHKVNGILVEAGNVQAWKSAIENLCLNPDMIADLSSRIPKVRDVREVAGEMENIYKNLLRLNQGVS